MVEDAINKAESLISLYDRVHAEIDEGRDWSDIDAGTGPAMSYDNWLAYMQQRIIGAARSIVLARRHSKQS